jgi:hypothetical protein
MITGRQLLRNRLATLSSVLSGICALVGLPPDSMMGKLHCLENLGEQQDYGSSLVVQGQNKLDPEFASVIPLLELMLQWDPIEFISIKEAIQSVFMSDLPSVNDLAELSFPESVMVPDDRERSPRTERPLTATHLAPVHLPRPPGFS